MSWTCPGHNCDVLGVCWSCRCVYLSQLTVLYRLKEKLWTKMHWCKMWWMVWHRLGKHCAQRGSTGGCPGHSFPVSHLTGHSRWSCKAWQLPAIPGAAGCAALLCWSTLLRASHNSPFWCYELIKKLLKCYQKPAWLLDSLFVPCLRLLKALWLSGLNLTRCYFSCRDCIASASNDDWRPCP